MKEERISELEVIDFNDTDEVSAQIETEECIVELGAEDAEDVSGNEKDAKRDTGSLMKELLSWGITFAVAFAVAFILKNHVIINAYVPTGSMENTIQGKSSLFGYRLAYVKEEPKRGDIIFFYYPDDETQKYVKRIIGLPGETITITQGKVYVNDSEVALEEPYLKEEWIRGTGPYTFEVPEDCYFVMGDNRNSSHDARYWVNTYVHKDKIIGKALFVYYPFSELGPVK